MALVHADFVQELTSTTGTGTYDLDGPLTGHRGFVAGIGGGNTCYYGCEDGTDWEVGIGLVTDAATDTLSRSQIIASSNAGAAVNWGAGSKNIYCTLSGHRTLTAPQTYPVTDGGLLAFNGTNPSDVIDSGITADANGNISAGMATLTTTISRTLTQTDNGKVLLCTNGAGINITLPNQATENILEGFAMNIVRAGAGSVNILTQGSDILYIVTGATEIRAQYAMISVHKHINATNSTWGVYGDLS
jgi:hypothetical protein